MLVLPALFINRNPDKVLVMENRRVPQFPSPFTPDGRRLTSKFIPAFENYLNDNIGFKELAIKANTIIKHKTFAQYSEPHVLSGKYGHLFYVPGDIAMPLTLPPYPPLKEDQLQEAMENIGIIRDYFAKRGIPFIFVAIPGKGEVYPEYYPEHLNRHETSRLAQIVSYINEHSDIDAFDLTPDLIAAKKDDYLLYYKNYDPTHWNMNGAFVGYVKMMERLSAYQNDLFILSKDDFSIEETPTVKKTRDGSYSFENLTDISYSYKYKNKFSAKLVESDSLTNGIAPLSKEDLATLNYLSVYAYYQNPKNNNGKKLLIFGDSFIYLFLLDYFAESFSEIYFLYTSFTSGEVMRAAETAFKPDFVLYQIVERIYMYTDNQFAHHLPLETR
jgi:hypothetical protein